VGGPGSVRLRDLRHPAPAPYWMAQRQPARHPRYEQPCLHREVGERRMPPRVAGHSGTSEAHPHPRNAGHHPGLTGSPIDSDLPTNRNMAMTNPASFTASQGTSKVRLMPEHAPTTVSNFVELATGRRQWLDP